MIITPIAILATLTRIARVYLAQLRNAIHLTDSGERRNASLEVAAFTLVSQEILSYLVGIACHATSNGVKRTFGGPVGDDCCRQLIEPNV
jgi:hypothetical protein